MCKHCLLSVSFGRQPLRTVEMKRELPSLKSQAPGRGQQLQAPAVSLKIVLESEREDDLGGSQFLVPKTPFCIFSFLDQQIHSHHVAVARGVCVLHLASFWLHLSLGFFPENVLISSFHSSSIEKEFHFFPYSFMLVLHTWMQYMYMNLYVIYTYKPFHFNNCLGTLLATFYIQ